MKYKYDDNLFGTLWIYLIRVLQISCGNLLTSIVSNTFLVLVFLLLVALPVRLISLLLLTFVV